MALRFFDAHLHIIDPRFPLQASQGYLPPPFTADEYVAAANPLGVVGGAVVSGSFQGFDQGYLLAALARLGPRYVGVTQLPPDATDAEIAALDAAGVRAVRFNLHRGGSAGVDVLESLALRVWELARWHVELYVDARHLPELSPVLARLPRFSVDHLGLSAAGLPHLLDWVGKGALVKATGFGRVDLDIGQALRAIVAINPRALLFGTDMPSTRAPRPFEVADIASVEAALEPAIASRVLWQNALELYRPREPSWGG